MIFTGKGLKPMGDHLETLIANAHASGILYEEFIREAKKRFILHVLIANKGNQCRAARELGKHRNTVSRDIAELKIDMTQFSLVPRSRRKAVQSAGRRLSNGTKVGA